MKKISRPTIAEINLTALKSNLNGIRKKVGKKVNIMAVVKANAYGHGIAEVSKFLEAQKINYFGVAIPEEGVLLREAGIKGAIHVFTIPNKEQAPLFLHYNLEPTVCTTNELSSLNSCCERFNKTLSIHLKIDTGMNRIGLRVYELRDFIVKLSKYPHLNVKGIFTHFAESDKQDKSYTDFQLSCFYSALIIVRNHRIEPEYIHCANSAAILDLPDTYFSMVRPGIMLYGAYPSHQTSESISLKQVMKLKSGVSLIKWINEGESVSYGRRFIAQRRTKIATVPIGYADGYSRLLSGKSECLIGGKKYPIVGTICMDQLMVDVGVDDVLKGDEVVLWGTQNGKQIHAWEIADILSTIPYEVYCNVSSRVPRIYIKK